MWLCAEDPESASSELRQLSIDPVQRRGFQLRTASEIDPALLCGGGAALCVAPAAALNPGCCSGRQPRWSCIGSA